MSAKKQKIFIAVDSFKDCLSSREINEICKDTLLSLNSNLQIDAYPISDGGEGFLDMILQTIGGEVNFLNVTGARGELIKSAYIIKKNIAYIEIAKIIGLELLEKKQRHAIKTSSYGLGELILEIVNQKQIREIVIGLGGSSTSDCGMGMLAALGVRFYDKDNQILKGCGENLVLIKRIDLNQVKMKLHDLSIKIVSDVVSPLLGEYGASYMFAEQKGASESEIELLEQGSRNFAMLTSNITEKNASKFKGAGSAGGLGYAFLQYFTSTIFNGLSYMCEYSDIEKCIENSDFVITGEGRVDCQTLHGKVPYGIAQIAKKYNKPVIVIAGNVGDKIDELNNQGLDAIFSITPRPMSLQEALKKEVAKHNVAQTITQIFKLTNYEKGE